MATGQLSFAQTPGYVAQIGTQNYLMINSNIDGRFMNLWYAYCTTNAKANMLLGTGPYPTIGDAYNACQNDFNSK